MLSIRKLQYLPEIVIIIICFSFCYFSSSSAIILWPTFSHVSSSLRYFIVPMHFIVKIALIRLLKIPRHFIFLIRFSQTLCFCSIPTSPSLQYLSFVIFNIPFVKFTLIWFWIIHRCPNSNTSEPPHIFLRFSAHFFARMPWNCLHSPWSTAYTYLVDVFMFAVVIHTHIW